MKSSILAIGLWVLTVDTASAQTFAVLKDFTGIDGNIPSGDLVLDGDTLYGTTWRNTGGPDAGRIFKVNTDGTDFAVLKSFEPAVWSGSAYTNSEGTYPYAGLTLSGGTLYGTAAGGGILGNGTLFLLDTNGSSFTVLESFTPGAWTDIQGISVWTNLDGAN